MTEELTIFEKSILNLARITMWDKVREVVIEELAEDCPNFDSCSESAFENYEPTHNEGYD